MRKEKNDHAFCDRHQNSYYKNCKPKAKVEIIMTAIIK